MKLCSSLRELCDYYDAFIIDLWGVIHDGSELYPSSLDTLQKLSLADKRIILLSNAPKRIPKVASRLAEFGIENNLYHSIITSGETVCNWLNIQSRFPKGTSYYIIGPEHDLDLIIELDYIRTDNIANADFVIAIGYDHDKSVAHEKDSLLLQMKKRSLPLICANPDKIIVKRNGDSSLCAGVMCELYQDMGGEVIYFGKPYSKVYEDSMDFFANDNIDASKVLAIGDNLSTDIRGANNYGIDSILVTSGVLNHKVGAKNYNDIPDMRLIDKLCKEESVLPTFVLPEFIW